jgi:hypothetical protein
MTYSMHIWILNTCLDIFYSAQIMQVSILLKIHHFNFFLLAAVPEKFLKDQCSGKCKTRKCGFVRIRIRHLKLAVYEPASRLIQIWSKFLFQKIFLKYVLKSFFITRKSHVPLYHLWLFDTSLC